MGAHGAPPAVGVGANPSPLALPKQPTAPSGRPARANTPTQPPMPAVTAAQSPSTSSLSPLPLPDSDPGAIKRGWLMKLRKSAPKRYWFVITAGGADGAEFSWRASDRPGPRKGFVMLRSALISVPKAQVDPNIAFKPNTLLVRPARGTRTKPLFVCANDRPELIQWLDQLLGAAHKE